MLSWTEEGAPGLLSDPKNPIFIVASVAAPEASSSQRKAQLSLSSDGTLEGHIEQSFTGHRSEARRGEWNDQDPAHRTHEWKEELTYAFPKAEVSAIQIEGMENPEVPLAIHYHLKIPAYGQRTSRPMLFQPLIFERGAPPQFEAAERRYDIFFPYSYRDRDELSIKLPEGFVLDNAENPGSLDFGKPGAYQLQMGVTPNRELIVTRELVFGREGILYFQRTTYPQIKKLFDSIHDRDTVTLSLRQEAP